MGSRRTVIVLAAVIVAAVAALATFQYLNTVQERANKDARLLKVFVVKKDIPKGTGGDQAINEEFVAADEINAKFRPATALTDLNTIRGKVSLTNLAANQVLVEGQFVDPQVAQVTAAELIPPGQVAITKSIDAVSAVAGLLVPGDKVNMIIDSPDGKRFLYQNVNILFIGTTAAPQPGQAETTVTPGTGAGLITFAVPPQVALRIAQAGNVILTLVPPDNQPVALPPASPDSLFSGPLTPYE